MVYTKEGKEKHVHTSKYRRCVEHVKKQGGKYNPHAVCMESIGKEEALLKKSNSVREFYTEEDMNQIIDFLEKSERELISKIRKSQQDVKKKFSNRYGYVD